MKRAEKVLLAHGDGGLLTQQLIDDLFVRHFSNTVLEGLNDAAVVDAAGRLAFTTDSFVVSPPFFPGGDIGKLAVCGTVNDLAVSGAVPAYLSVAMILEEGLEMELLEEVVVSMAETARHAGVQIITGDTKVVEHGSADKLFINTSGIGTIPSGIHLGYERVSPGDVLIVNGSIGEHGTAILSRREGISFDSPVISDCTCLNALTGELLRRFETVKIMRDPTRGGLATTVKELARQCRCDFRLFEESIPVSEGVAGIADLLGVDPLYLANEGKVLFVASRSEADSIIAFLKNHSLGQQAAVIGEVSAGQGEVLLKTALGGTRNLGLLSGRQLPRIC